MYYYMSEALMNTFEVNGNLKDELNLNFDMFFYTIQKVYMIYEQVFGKTTMESIDLYIDNATSGSGYTPNITVVHRKYLILKLGVGKDSLESQIAFQVAHELMHYVFYAKKGLDKKKAGPEEEAVCSAASLCIIKLIYPLEFEWYYNYVCGLENEGYRKGALIADQIQYDLKALGTMI